MPRLATCSFCGNQIEQGTGLMYVLGDGSILWFCSGKCFRSYQFKRDPRKLKWTRKYGQQAK
ncbi:MAG: 50S ribosomal protein L24e [Desulfurococcaceae archaeon]